MNDWNLRDTKFLIGISCLLFIVGIALAGHVLSPYPPEKQNLLYSLQAPFTGHEGYYLGTDQLGRDMLARMASGARVSLLIAVSVVALSGVIGVAVGAISGYLGGFRDMLIQKIVEAFWAFPPILLAIAIMATLGQSLVNLVFALVVQRWIPYARLARSQAMSLRSREFVAASTVLGGGSLWIIRHHILPNVLPAAVVVATFSMASAIISEASLSFLGLGVPPGTATWGGMLAESRSYVTRAWWLAVFPGAGIFITVLGLNLLGDWLRDVLDPKDN